MQIKSNSLYLKIGAVLVALILLNVISRDRFKRLDLTDNKMYSLSSSSKEVVSQVDDLLKMKVYFSSDLPMKCSLSASKELVASSRRRHAGDFIIALAIARRCFCPPDKPAPPSTRIVSSPSGNCAMN